MKTKENLFIIFKIIKHHAIPIAVMLIAITLFFVNFFRPDDVFASVPVAEVEMNIVHVNKGREDILQQSKKTLTYNESSAAGLNSVNVNFTSTSELEFNYRLKNITDNDCLINIQVNENSLENLLIKYYIKDESGLLTNYSFNIKSGEELEIKVVVSIENLARNASFDGDIMLTIANLGE